MLGKINKMSLITAILFSLTVIITGGCSFPNYTPEKVRYTTKPTTTSKYKKISRNHSKPVVKQTYPLEKKYIIPHKRSSTPPW